MKLKKNEGRKCKISKYYKQLFTFPCLKTFAVQNESYMKIIAFKREMTALLKVSVFAGVCNSENIDRRSVQSL